MPQGKVRVGILFGSFNPIHHGHLNIGEYFHRHHHFAEVWYVLSPQSPFKAAEGLAPARIRRKMAEAALSPHPHFRLITDEMNRPPPHYTYHTLQELQEKHPNHEFILIMGEDNTLSLDKWYRGEWIMKHFEVLTYPRRDSINSKEDHHESHWKKLEARKTEMPYIDISASIIRDRIKKGLPISDLLPSAVEKIIRKEKLYLT